jgi:hypothetical protein
MPYPPSAGPRLLDGRMAHVLDDALAACHDQYVQHNELMPPAFKALFYSAARGKHRSASCITSQTLQCGPSVR